MQHALKYSVRIQLLGDLKGRDHLGDFRVDERIVLKWNVQ
jgi:hypothetical protein